MSAQMRGTAWRKSSRSSGAGNCVELAVGTAYTAVRDAKKRDGGILLLSADAFAAFRSFTQSRCDPSADAQ